jgi:hypothetical protein
MRQQDRLCLPHEAAKHLGISVDEVLKLISNGELAAVKYMDDDRWFIESDSLERMARKARGQDARLHGRVRRWAVFSRFLQRCVDAIF